MISSTFEANSFDPSSLDSDSSFRDYSEYLLDDDKVNLEIQWMQKSTESINPSIRIINAHKATDTFNQPFLPIPVNDRIVRQNHFRATSNITPPETYFPLRNGYSLSVETLANETIKQLQRVNQPYSQRDAVRIYYYHTFLSGELRLQSKEMRLGVYYPKVYQKYQLPELKLSTSLDMSSLPNYFYQNNKANLVAGDNGCTPNQCLNAFFYGPTTADCGTTLLACQYQAMENIIGTDAFNHIFDQPLSPFKIAPNLFGDPKNLPTLSKQVDSEPNAYLHLINPLICLFDIMFLTERESYLTDHSTSENRIKKGDIIYICGVKDYTKKHGTGSDTGFNLIWTGKNDKGENLYLGFEPKTMQAPNTFEELKKTLIDGYNEEQNEETKTMISEGATHYAQWSDHTLPENGSIVGLTLGLRFSIAKWHRLTSPDNPSWPYQPLQTLPSQPESKAIHFATILPVENQHSKFEHFIQSTDQQKNLYNTAQKFACAVINNAAKPDDQKAPMGLFLSGSAGIGKTHLCVAVAKESGKYGVNVLYIDAVITGQYLKDMSGAEDKWHQRMDALLQNKDLIVFDDIPKLT